MDARSSVQGGTSQHRKRFSEWNSVAQRLREDMEQYRARVEEFKKDGSTNEWDASKVEEMTIQADGFQIPAQAQAQNTRRKGTGKRVKPEPGEVVEEHEPKNFSAALFKER